MKHFRIALCNEVVAALPFERQCALAAALGYDGLEVAPFTLSDDPATLSSAARADLRRAAEREGIAITGLHWLLNAPAGLSITSGDARVQQKTRDHVAAMVDLCAELGGDILVHGSPKQRALGDAATPDAARANAVALFRHAAERAGAAGVTYCIEPLSPILTDFVTTIDEARAIVDEIAMPALATMLDTCAAWSGEHEQPDALIRRHLPSGAIRHVHLNDDNNRAPGQGARGFAPVMRALLDLDYRGVVGIEPFDYHPDGSTAAARAIGYLQGLMETMEARS
ncbi:sugar phosphate isomerase/epimerase family protein [Mesorhizobium sp. CAU 1741]|uniref:sugar phosphate isomerase/epimerase family protein n=1 Tax=Mesorhizobium sp. CAU 1741 TaxID=3140366 RepID=UPI00325ACE47